MRVPKADKRRDILHLQIEGNSIRSMVPDAEQQLLSRPDLRRQFLRAVQFAVKRILDYIGSGLGVLLLGPLMLGIAVIC